jgi:hypothetical protein
MALIKEHFDQLQWANENKYSGPGFLGHEIVLNQVSKEKEHGKGWKPLWCNGGRA